MYFNTNEEEKNKIGNLFFIKKMLFRSKLRKKSVRKIALPNFNCIIPLKQKLCDENKDHG